MNLEFKTVRLRSVEVSDAGYILSLRLDSKYNKFLSGVSPDLGSQVRWIERYKLNEAAKEEFYFIIERLDGVACGTVRIYDLKADSFCWGSWILDKNKTRYAAIESALLVYRFGFNVLGFAKSHFDVMKGNDKVVSFHKKMGATQISEDLDNYYFEISQDSVIKAEAHLSRVFA